MKTEHHGIPWLQNTIFQYHLIWTWKMNWFKNIFQNWQKKNILKSHLNTNNNYLALDINRNSREEEENFGIPGAYDPVYTINNEALKQHLINEDHANDIEEKKRFAKHAYEMNKIWIKFLMIIVFLQGLKIDGFELDEWGFRVIFITTTASVFSFAYLVGKYLFPSHGRIPNKKSKN